MHRIAAYRATIFHDIRDGEVGFQLSLQRNIGIAFRIAQQLLDKLRGAFFGSNDKYPILGSGQCYIKQPPLFGIVIRSIIRYNQVQHRVIIHFRWKSVDFILCIDDNHIVSTQPFRAVSRQKLEFDFASVFYRINLPRFLVVVELLGIAEIPRIESVAADQKNRNDSGFAFVRIVSQYLFDCVIHSNPQIMVTASFRPLFSFIESFDIRVNDNRIDDSLRRDELLFDLRRIFLYECSGNVDYLLSITVGACDFQLLPITDGFAEPGKQRKDRAAERIDRLPVVTYCHDFGITQLRQLFDQVITLP